MNLLLKIYGSIAIPFGTYIGFMNIQNMHHSPLYKRNMSLSEKLYFGAGIGFKSCVYMTFFPPVMYIMYQKFKVNPNLLAEDLVPFSKYQGL